MISLFLFLRFDQIPIVTVDAYGKQCVKYIEEWPCCRISDLNLLKGDIKWVVFAKKDTAVSPYYLKHILESISDKNAIVGRFGCLPTQYMNNQDAFTTCQPYPLLKSAFAVTYNLFKTLPSDFNFSEYEFGQHLKNFKYYDDIHFHYFASDHATRGKEFAASYFPKSSSTIMPELAHISGLEIPYLAAPTILHRLKIGSQFQRDLRVPTINFKCGNYSFIEPTPLTFQRELTLRVNCFN